jgi:hypothetical protein
MLKGPMAMVIGFAVAYAFLLPVAAYVKMNQQHALPAHQLRTM